MNERDYKESSVTVLKCYDLVLWLARKIEKFPRSYKFTVGDRIMLCSFEVLESLTVASYSKRMADPLRNAVTRLAYRAELCW